MKKKTAMKQTNEHILLPYQRRWVEDRSRFKIALKARQIGFSFCLALEAVLEAQRKKQQVILLSVSERQSRELMEKVYMHLRAFGHLTGDALKAEAELRSECVLKNGAKIISLPANPRTVRGFSGSIFLDEFAFHQDAEKIFRAIMPTITRGGYRIRIVSTPAGDAGKFWELWKHDNNFSKHRVDIYQAIEEGLGISLDELRANIDAETFAQEYECQFLSELGPYFGIDLIASCVSGEVEREPEKIFGNCYIGVDIGRKHDLTVIYIVEKLEDVFFTRRVEVLENTSFSSQESLLEDLIGKYHPRRVCIDASGLGMQLAENMQRKYYFVEPVTFTGPIKEELAVTTKIAFEQRAIRIPENKPLLDDIRSIKKYITIAGNVRFDANRTGAGHADRFWALALALHAGTQTIYVKPEYTRAVPRQFSRESARFGAGAY